MITITNESEEHHCKDLTFDVEWITAINDGLARQDMEASVIDIEKSAYAASLPLNRLNQLDVNYKAQAEFFCYGFCFSGLSTYNAQLACLQVLHSEGLGHCLIDGFLD